MVADEIPEQGQIVEVQRLVRGDVERYPMEAQRVARLQLLEDLPGPAVRAQVVFGQDLEPVETGFEILFEACIVLGTQPNPKNRGLNVTALPCAARLTAPFARRGMRIGRNSFSTRFARLGLRIGGNIFSG